MVPPTTQPVITVAGTGTAGTSTDGGQATSAALNAPQSVIFAPAISGFYSQESNVFVAGTTDSIYIADTKNGKIRRVGSNGIISTVACTPVPVAPSALAVDASGRVYFSDPASLVVYMDGAVVAGMVGVSGFEGDGECG